LITEPVKIVSRWYILLSETKGGVDDDDDENAESKEKEKEKIVPVVNPYLRAPRVSRLPPVAAVASAKRALL
jgi:hypothetical protein